MRISHNGPSFWQTVDESFASLRLVGRRSILALLGISVGCASVVALLNIGHNATSEAIKAFKGLGTNTVIVSLSTQPNVRRLAPVTIDAPALKVAVQQIRYIAPIIIYPNKVRHSGRGADVIVVGSTPDLSSVLGLTISQGRNLSEYDAHSTFALAGVGIAKELGLRIGSRLQIEGYLFEIVGIIDHHLANPMFPIAPDSAILVPMKSMRRLMPSPEISSLVTQVTDSDHVQQAAESLKIYLASTIPTRTIDVQIPEQLLEGLKKQTNAFSYLLAGLGGISLLVGGVGIMNIMLTNVAERRREIGIRAALGARQRDIRDLFLVEATVLSTAGAIVGALAGLVVSYAFVKISGWTFSLSLPSVPLAILSSFCIGVLFGLYPALSAARLPLVRALRDD